MINEEEAKTSHMSFEQKTIYKDKLDKMIKHNAAWDRNPVEGSILPLIFGLSVIALFLIALLVRTI